MNVRYTKKQHKIKPERKQNKSNRTNADLQTISHILMLYDKLYFRRECAFYSQKSTYLPVSLAVAGFS